MRIDVDVVRRRHGDDDLELARQVGFAVDRLDDLLLATGDALAIEPDLAIGRRARQQMVGQGTGERERSGVGALLIGVRLHSTLRSTSPHAARVVSSTSSISRIVDLRFDLMMPCNWKVCRVVRRIVPLP